MLFKVEIVTIIKSHYSVFCLS